MRMAVAMLVAVMLHAFMLIIPVQTSTILPSLHNKPLQIRLITAADPAPPATIPDHESASQHQPAQTRTGMQKKHQKNTWHHTIRNTSSPIMQRRQNRRSVPAFNKRKHMPAVVKPSAPLHTHPPAEKTKPLAVRQQNEQTRKKHDEQPAASMPVPEDAQASLLMHVSYPRQARRHGWQGKVELRFDIQQHTIRHVTVLTSSGYPVLDRAAYRALTHMQHIALADGIYRMPVVFRLQ